MAHAARRDFIRCIWLSIYFIPLVVERGRQSASQCAFVGTAKPMSERGPEVVREEIPALPLGESEIVIGARDDRPVCDWRRRRFFCAGLRVGAVMAQGSLGSRDSCYDASVLFYRPVILFARKSDTTVPTLLIWRTLLQTCRPVSGPEGRIIAQRMKT